VPLGITPVAEQRVERRLAAILATDVAGYTRLMGADEEGTLSALESHRRELIDPAIGEHRGRIVKTTGDGILIEFPSVVDAVQCAVAVQRGMAERNQPVAPARRIDLRIGINLGDIIVRDGDIFGDGVNVAARLEGMAEPGGILVSSTVREQVLDKLQLDFDDLGECELKNMARRVRVYRVARAPTGPAARNPGGSMASDLPSSDKPAIAVLPFANMSGDPEHEYFADGMVEEIITSLSRIKWLQVIARTSSFAYKGRSVDIKQIGRELGVRYVLEGSVRKSGSRVRITGQLIDAVTGAHLWADRFDGSLENIFELQDQVAVSVAGVIEPTLVSAEIHRSTARRTDDPTVYDLYLRALSHLQTWEREAAAVAKGLLEQAIERDPEYGPALAMAARCRQDLHVNGWSSDPDADRKAGIGLARRALKVARDDPGVLSNAAYALAYFGEDIEAAMTLVDRALALNPSFARGWVQSGWLRLWAGQPELAVTHFEAALRLSPGAGRVGAGGALLPIGIAHFFARRFDDASKMLQRAVQEHPAWAPGFRFLASCYAQMGRLDDARQIVGRLRELTPTIVPTATHWRDPAQREFYLSGLRKAAGEPG
jgi:TolB-like protein/class 3 adenylate cyclase/tetratricopeptide (TPR) repeat protein